MVRHIRSISTGKNSNEKNGIMNFSTNTYTVIHSYIYIFVLPRHKTFLIRQRHKGNESMAKISHTQNEKIITTLRKYAVDVA